MMNTNWMICHWMMNCKTICSSTKMLNIFWMTWCCQKRRWIIFSNRQVEEMQWLTRNLCGRIKPSPFILQTILVSYSDDDWNLKQIIQPLQMKNKKIKFCHLLKSFPVRLVLSSNISKVILLRMITWTLHQKAVAPHPSASKKESDIWA